MDKFKIIEIAIDMAADDGVDYDDLSPGKQMGYYKKAYEDYLDRMADRADMMRKGEADGGFMRKNYAMGSDEDEFPEAEDIPTDEYLELLKQLGAPMPGQESGIRSLNKMASDDSNDRLLEKIYEDLLEQGFTPEEAAQKARQMFDEMAGKKPVVDPMLLDQYLKYVDEMREMGREPMSIRQFTEQARAGAQVGGLASII